MNDFKAEWQVLHVDIEKYERYALLIKLVAIIVSAIFIYGDESLLVSILIILVTWLNEGIWRTFQSRLADRIMIVEKNLHIDDAEKDNAFLLYSQWEKQRPSTIGLIKEYLKNSLRPTVAYPYVVLIIILVLFLS